MPRFIGKNDITFINHISAEAVEKVVDTRVLFYKVNKSLTTYNVYGEVDDNHKIKFNNPIQLSIFINKQDQQTVYEDNIDRNQNIRFSFLRPRMAKLGIYPEEGDVIFFYNSFFMVDEIIENQFIAGQPRLLNNHSIVVETHMVPRNELGIVEHVG